MVRPYVSGALIWGSTVNVGRRGVHARKRLSRMEAADFNAYTSLVNKVVNYSGKNILLSKASADTE
jgi:hypothetical protein